MHYGFCPAFVKEKTVFLVKKKHEKCIGTLLLTSHCHYSCGLRCVCSCNNVLQLVISLSSPDLYTCFHFSCRLPLLRPLGRWLTRPVLPIPEIWNDERWMKDDCCNWVIIVFLYLYFAWLVIFGCQKKCWRVMLPIRPSKTGLVLHITSHKALVGWQVEALLCFKTSTYTQ